MKINPLILSVIFSALYALLTVVQQSAVRSVIIPEHLNFLSNFTAALIIGTYFITFNRRALAIHSRKGLVIGILAGIIGSGLADYLVLIGLGSSPAINWGILSRLSILSTVLFSYFLLKEKILKKEIVVFVLALAGSIIVVWPANNGVFFSFGDLIFLLAVISYGLLNVTSETALKYILPAQFLLTRLIAGAFVTALPLVIKPLDIKLLADAPVIILPILINTFSLIAGISLVNLIIKSAGASYFALASNLVPIFTVILSVIILKENPTPLQLLGGLVIVGSLVYFVRRRTRAHSPRLAASSPT